MGRDLYAGLAWLPRSPADFRHRCRTIGLAGDRAGCEIRALAQYALGENDLRRLADAIDRLRADGSSLAPLTPFALGVVGNATLEPLVPALVASAARYGIALECARADYGQTVQEALSPDSRINSAAPDAVLLAVDYRGLPIKVAPTDRATQDAMVAEALGFIATMRDGFRSHSRALSIVQTISVPPEATFGSLDVAVPGTLRSIATALNAKLVESIEGSEDLLFDVASLADTVGVASWHSPTQWNVAKLPFDATYLPLYADHAVRVIAALCGKSRRCLILDLDNTVWGGVIGDDGLEGIVVGQGDATGEAYLDVQRFALALRERGIVLAVSSKNDDKVARAAFVRHPEMLLREEHVAVFQANWNDKATNIRAIAEELALGTDAMVFLDDSPVERGFIRETLPEVAVPELPDDPALYARTLAAAGYFEAAQFSAEDRNRAAFYAGNARRVALRSQSGDIESYLASLNMRIQFRPFDAAGRSRIAQLVNKSNQFNLTTRRYSEAEVEAMEANPDCFTLQVRLADTFGDNGMISVIVCRARSVRAWELDTWLMSCRVLGRGVERMVLRELVYHARMHEVERLLGVFVPTERNGMVRDHYAKLGFRLIDEDPGGATTWDFETTTDVDALPMEVERAGFETTFVRPGLP